MSRHHLRRRLRRVAVPVATAAAAAALAAPAFGHAAFSPPVFLATAGQQFTLSVPTEKQGATTRTIELTVPGGFHVDSFEPTPRWKRTVAQTGSGEHADISRVTWSGGSVPTGEDAVFRLNGSASHTGTYSFRVRQTYSDGSVADWSGPESADAPAPTAKAVSSLGGGGGGSDTLAIVALVVGAVGLLVGLVGLLGRRRALA